ncbi:hypothetical protein [Pseudomonas arsenicoxydans]|uniref:BIG2 domain-containing protein n=1 Tax=Pseudomonas arsenicoxydans TaxID=702115 RepID=A0A502HXK9_9PSED|nr:hypothetical protein [Pseudomonas arsenicoxydans]TPG79529.1 hypothetical protein EAH78_06760 [Pseudomonas arsenicoxydans]
MTTPESPDNSVLVMDPPWVLLATQPVVDADVGLPLASYDLIPDGEGATAVVNPPLSGTVELDDVIRLWLVGDATFLSSAFITDVNAKTSLRIPKGRLYSDQINKLFYTITRGSSNVGKSEPNLTLLYNKIRPALKDRFPETDGHSELELRLADDIKNGVGPDFVSAQVWVSYPYCRAYDTITLKCNGEIMTYKVRPDEAPQPPNPGSADPIAVCFTVTRAYLESAVRPGGKLHFSCTCTDQIGNTTDTDAVWSATQTVDEDLAGLLLPAALLREQLNDPDDDLSVIDLEKLGGKPLLLVILTADSRFRVGYTLNAVYTATLTGQADVVVRVSGMVEADEFGQKKICVLEVPNDKVLAGRTVTVMYELFDGATLVGRSKAATALVVGENTIEIDAPRLLAPATIPVDALDHEQGVNVRVDFAAAQPGDKAQLVLRNPLPGSPDFPELSLDQTFAIFNLDVVFLGLWHGKAPELSWDLIRGGKVIAQSLPLVLTVLPILNEDDRLPTPKILQAANNGDGPELDVSNLTPGATVRCLVWPLIAFGQPVWLHLRGKNAIGGEHNITLLRHPTNAVHQAWLNAGYYDVSVLYSYLKDLGDGSVLEVWFTAALDKGTDESKAVTFPIRTYRVKVIPDLIIDESPLFLTGANFSIRGAGLPWTHSGADPVGTYADRTPTSGILPYEYFTSDNKIAIVDGSGRVRSEGNGTARITVTDGLLRSASYDVNCTNVNHIVWNPTPMDAYQAAAWTAAIGATAIIPYETNLSVLGVKFRAAASFIAWSTDRVPGNGAVALGPNTAVPPGGSWKAYVSTAIDLNPVIAMKGNL